jgi:hypothetical protein
VLDENTQTPVTLRRPVRQSALSCQRKLEAPVAPRLRTPVRVSRAFDSRHLPARGGAVPPGRSAGLRQGLDFRCRELDF